MPSKKRTAPARSRSTASQPAGEVRTITDVRTMRALTHPVRIALLETLFVEGPMTATEAGELIGESPTTCSFHLRQLAKYGFVEEAGGGKGRSRPWQMTTVGFSLTTGESDAEQELAASALLRMLRTRQLERYGRWLETRSSYPKQWRDATFDSEYILHLTPEELVDLSAQINDLVMPLMRERVATPSARPAGSLPVELLVFTFPVRPAREDRS